MFCFRKTWNNVLPHIVKYLALLDVKWNLPTSAQADISHLRSKYFTAKRFHLPERANFVAYLLYGRYAKGICDRAVSNGTTPTDRKKDEESLRFFVFFPWQALLLWAQKHIVKCFAFAKREIMCYRTLWNISPCSMWNEICPRPRKRTFHICGANISPRSDFTCP